MGKGRKSASLNKEKKKTTWKQVVFVISVIETALSIVSEIIGLIRAIL